MKIGDLAVASDTGIETIRFYEREALLPAPGRTQGNFRIYEQAHLERLRFIRRCRSLDMSLDDVRVLLRFKDEPGAACQDAPLPGPGSEGRSIRPPWFDSIEVDSYGLGTSTRQRRLLTIPRIVEYIPWTKGLWPAILPVNEARLRSCAPGFGAQRQNTAKRAWLVAGGSCAQC